MRKTVRRKKKGRKKEKKYARNVKRKIKCKICKQNLNTLWKGYMRKKHKQKSKNKRGREKMERHEWWKRNKR